MPHVDADELRRFAAQILLRAGLDPDDAHAVAEGLVHANLRGVDSHGVLRLMQYVKALQSGEITAHPDVRVIQRRGATALVDAGGGYGFRPTRLAIDIAGELADAVGVGIVGVRNSHHFGMAATYVLRAAASEKIGLLMTTTIPVLAPPGGAEPRVGNNPLAVAIPAPPPRPPIVLDMALSEVAFGKIRLAAAEGRPIPLGWAFDAAGRPTTDAVAALHAGLLAPVGQHKGYGLAVIAEVLAGVMTGSPFGLQSDAHGKADGGVGHVAIVIDPFWLVSRERFYSGIEQLVAEIKSVPLAEGAKAVYLPGEPEWETLQARQAAGIPISDELADQLLALAERLHVSPLVGKHGDEPTGKG